LIEREGILHHFRIHEAGGGTHIIHALTLLMTCDATIPAAQ
jgi:hypothetical protein